MRRRNTAASSLPEPFFMSRHRFQKQTCHLGLNDEASVMPHSVVRPLGRPTNLVMTVDETIHIRPLNKKQRFSFSRKKYLNSLHYNKNQTTYLSMNVYTWRLCFIHVVVEILFLCPKILLWHEGFSLLFHSRFILFLFSHILRESILKRY